MLCDFRQEAMNGNIPTDYEKCCNLEIVRRGGLVLFCDYVVCISVIMLGFLV